MCGEVWRSCRCARWDQGRLRARGEQLAHNFMPAAQAHGRNQAAAALQQVRDADPVTPPQLLTMQQHQQAQLQVQQQAQQQAILGAQAQLQAQQQAHQQAIERAVQQAIQHVQTNHECEHESFRTYHGEPGAMLDCEICGGSYRTWIKQCKRCLSMMCVRCKNNRL